MQGETRASGIPASAQVLCEHVPRKPSLHFLRCQYLFDSANENLEVGPNFKADTTQPHPHSQQVRDLVVKIIRLQLRESDHCNHPTYSDIGAVLNTCVTVGTLFSIFRGTLLIFKYDTYLSVV